MPPPEWPASRSTPSPKLLLDIGEAAGRLSRRARCGTRHARSSRLMRFGRSWLARRRTSLRVTRATTDFGDVWTWTALAADSKLICSWYVGGRAYEDAASVHGRPTNGSRTVSSSPRTVTVPSDAVGPRVPAQHRLRADRQGLRVAPTRRTGRYSPAVCTGGESVIAATPTRQDLDQLRRAQNLKSDEQAPVHAADQWFAKMLDNHMAAIARHFLIQRRPAGQMLPPLPRTPAMAAGIADHVWTLRDIAANRLTGHSLRVLRPIRHREKLVRLWLPHVNGSLTGLCAEGCSLPPRCSRLHTA